MNPVLVTGGAGFIGSHSIAQLLQMGWYPIVVDNLSNGFRESLPEDVPFYQIDVRNKQELKSIFAKYNFSAVVHLAGLAVVEDSFFKKEEYIDINLNGTNSVLELCQEFGVKNFIFSSSSTIYGDGNEAQKLTEKHNIAAISPYGKSKLLCERKIYEFSQRFDFNCLILRYFNVAGADSDLKNGPRGHGSGRVFFNAAKAAVCGDSFVVNGHDYPTADGTCIRDYIHVEDISDIHVRGLDYLWKQQTANLRSQLILNCGYGEGFSVLQIIENFKKKNNIDFKVEWGPKRKGDPAYLVGDNSELVKLLNWKSKFSNPLEAICQSAYLWEKKQHQLTHERS